MTPSDHSEKQRAGGAGYFGKFGGQYVAETLMPALQEISDAFEHYWADTTFRQRFHYYLKHYVGRPSPLYFAERLTQHFGGARIYLKREDLNHTGAHKINNTLGQALLARHMEKPRLIAETGAGMHGVATATVAALFGLNCEVFMGEEDVHRQAPNVARMRALGAEIKSVKSGSATLKDALNEALRDWVATSDDTLYVIGSVAGPHPYPTMVRSFQSVIGTETREQMLEQEGRLPDEIVACVGGGSNALGIFHPFLDDAGVKLTGVEAAGESLGSGRHAASISGGKVGVLHGTKSYLLQDTHGQVQTTHSVSAGLDYPGVGPEHALLHETDRATYTAINDQEAVDAFHLLCRIEGIIPALEPAHAIAEAAKRAPQMAPEQVLVINLSGRGDKDMESVEKYDKEHAKSGATQQNAG